MAKIKKRFLFSGLIILIVGAYGLGPHPEKPIINTSLPSVKNNLSELENEINISEKNHPTLKPDNEARIIWADPSQKVKTKYSIIYLHGFSASQAEGEPVHREFASRYGCNLYLSRLEQHGLDTVDVFKNITAEGLLKSAEKAVAIGKQLGDSLIIIATSNGGAMALYIASDHPEIKGLIIYSPLIEFYDPATFLLNKPWGLQIARKVSGGDFFKSIDSTAMGKKYWTTRYRLEGAVALKNMIDNITGEKIYNKIKMPVFLGYYYKDEQNQDEVVSVKAMLKMFAQLGTDGPLKRKYAFAKAGHHVVASKYKSHELNNVKAQTFKFAEEILNLKPKNP